MPAEQSNLLPRDILVELLKGNKIRVHLSTHEFKRLVSNLNVLKSRDKKLYQKYGFDHERVVIRWTYDSIEKDIKSYTYTIWAEKPKEGRKIPVFVILPSTLEPMNNQGIETQNGDSTNSSDSP